MASNIKNTADLRKMLLDVIEDVRRERIEPGAAKAISGLASQVLASAKLDLDAHKVGLGETKPAVNATLLTYHDNVIRSPYEGIKDEEYDLLLAMKAEGKALAQVCDKLKGVDKKIVGAIYYGKEPETNE